MEKKEWIRLIISILLVTLVIVGITYAWFSWKSTNSNISGSVGCFDIVYDKGQDIGNADSPYALRPTCDYKNGASASVTINMNENCYTVGKASINLKTTSFTLHDGSDAFATTTKNVLRYQVTKTVDNGEEVLEKCNGYVNDDTNISLCEIDLDTTPTTYNIYLYLDCNTTTTTYIGSSYVGYIQSVAYQSSE